MKVQFIQDSHGKNAGVFIPMEEWLRIKEQYPDIENTDTDLPDWEKALIDERLSQIQENPDRLKDGKMLIDRLMDM